MADRVRRKRGFLGYLFRFVNIIIILALLISYTAQWVSPTLFWPIAFFGLAFPILFLFNLFFILYWLLIWRKFIIYPLIVFIIGLPLMGRFFNIGNNSEIVDINSPFKVLTYNVHVFDQYHSQYENSTYARDGILEYLKKENADIYCLQEFYNRADKNNMDNIKIFMEELKTPFCYYSKYSPKSKYLYNIIFSKKQIIAKGDIRNTSNSGEMSGIYTDIKINSNIIRVYSVHLQSFQISSDKEFLNLDYDIQSTKGQEEIKNNSIKLTKKFKIAFEARSKQIANLKKHISTCDIPIIVAGDFNDTPSSYSYGQLTANLDDSFMDNGKGFGKTYIGPFPSFRIDYILHSPQLLNYKYATGKTRLSDHYPIMAVFSASDIND